MELELEEALDCADQAAYALREAQHKLTGKCWMTVEVYPHPGCAEFAGPDTFFCDNPGTFWVLDEDEYGSEMSPHMTWWLVCDEHRALEPNTATVQRR